MTTLEKLSDDLWCGRTSTADRDHHPFANLKQIEEVASGVAFYKAFSNMTVFKTQSGAVLIDTGSFHPAAHTASFDAIRSWTPAPIDTAIYTHGHVDHAYGLPPFIEEAKSKKWDSPKIIGHSCVAHRMDRYIETAGYNAVINERQFGYPVEWPVDPIYPTRTYEKELHLKIGGETILLFHGKGETDDHTWVFLPRQRVLCTGDFFIWASPNAGNPQKVQRYVREWAEALRKMASKKPLVLLPGHGVPVFGEGRVQTALLDTADYLESIYTQTIEMMNQGATIDELIHSVKVPESLAEMPYLKPVYDEPEFVVRNLFRCYGGWYGGVPSELKPAPRRDQAREIVSMAGGIAKVVRRVKKLLKAGDLVLACHLADWAADAEPDSTEVHELRAEVYRERRDAETSTMAKGVYGAAARESAAHAKSTA